MHLNAFGDHDPGLKQAGFDGDQKCYCQSVVQNGGQSDRFQLSVSVISLFAHVHTFSKRFRSLKTKNHSKKWKKKVHGLKKHPM